MILSKGRVAYVGEADAAAEYFATIGYALPPNTNPAEHFLDIVNADFSSNDEVDRILDEWSMRKKKEDDGIIPTEVASSLVLNDSIQHKVWLEIQVMLRRHVTLMLRDPVIYSGRIIMFLVVNSLFGVVYIAARNYTQDQA
jgi:hypothetical protein